MGALRKECAPMSTKSQDVFGCRFLPEDITYTPSMTLIVGFPCREGVVIACDRATQEFTPEGARQIFLSDKFRINPHNRWACAWAGNGGSRIASRKIQIFLDAQDRRLSPESLRRELELIGDRSSDEHQREHGGQTSLSSCFIVYDHGKPDVSRGGIQIGFYELTVSFTSRCDPVIEYPKCLGDYSNPASFFGKSLFKQLIDEESSMDEIAFISGFIVVSGHKFNPSTIQGLSILICRPGDFSVIDKESVIDIYKRAEHIGKDIMDGVRQECVSFKEKRAKT